MFFSPNIGLHTVEFVQWKSKKEHNYHMAICSYGAFTMQTLMFTEEFAQLPKLP